MMRLFDNSNDNFTAVVRVFGTITLLLILAIFYLGHQLGKAREDININIPPDLSLGATVRPDNIPKTAVYDFASRIFQSLHRWRFAGSKEYKENIAKYSDFFTPAYRAFLERDFTRRLKDGELSGRERALQPLLAAWNYELVKVVRSENGIPVAWVVALDMELTETYKGETVKRLFLRYPMQVVRRPVDPNLNPWGLTLAGYAADPEPLKLEKK